MSFPGSVRSGVVVRPEPFAPPRRSCRTPSVGTGIGTVEAIFGFRSSAVDDAGVASVVRAAFQDGLAVGDSLAAVGQRHRCMTAQHAPASATGDLLPRPPLAADLPEVARITEVEMTSMWLTEPTRLAVM